MNTHIKNKPDNNGPLSAGPSRPRILFVVDMPNWAHLCATVLGSPGLCWGTIIAEFEHIIQIISTRTAGEFSYAISAGTWNCSGMNTDDHSSSKRLLRLHFN